MPFPEQIAPAQIAAAERPVQPAATGPAGPRLIRRETRAMASVVTVHVPATGPDPTAAAPPVETAISAALEEFHILERACTRFDPASPLMRANRSPQRWHRVPEALYATLVEAARAHGRTGGLFDPRVHDRLIELGYDRSFHLIAADPTAGGGAGAAPPRPRRRPWRPRLVPGLRLIRLGSSTVDLGGVGKGVALSRAASSLRRAARDFLIDAGGDIYASGRPDPAMGWRIGVESPCGSPDPLAVLEISDRAAATSSIRLRRWRAGQRMVHHLIDPRTGEPGGRGLAAVTVVHEDPVVAETWAKALFLTGREAIAGRADSLGLAALWVGTDDRTGMSPTMAPYVIWERR